MSELKAKAAPVESEQERQARERLAKDAYLNEIRHLADQLRELIEETHGLYWKRERELRGTSYTNRRDQARAILAASKILQAFDKLTDAAVELEGSYMATRYGKEDV